MPQRALILGLIHARTLIKASRREYNEERLKNALGGMPPAAYARKLAEMGYPNTGL